jgi:pyruvate/2-oxoglutarate dehydrogenase complex dihydrolipoamide acyltransferase (E2) component
MLKFDKIMDKGTIVEWLKQDGQSVREGEPLATVETEKFTVELPSPATGTFVRTHEAGYVAEVGEMVGRVFSAGEQVQTTPAVAPAGEVRTPEQLREGFSSLCSEVDRAALTDEVVAYLIESGREGLRPGDAGMRDDNLSTILPWGFDLGAIRVPVQIWHGGQDRFVPVTHGEWLGARIPNAEVHLEPEEGHLTTFVRRVPAVQGWLADRF